jgi:hypothetical protein
VRWRTTGAIMASICPPYLLRTGLPALADELRLRIKTGVYCVYLPDPAHPTDWAL